MKDRSHEILPTPLLEEIPTAATVRAFPKHAVIVTESDVTDTIYVMLAGRARVYVSDEKGREVVLNQLGPGEYFGEITIDGGPRSASVMALEECRCALIRGTELTAFIERSPGFALHVVKKLAHRVRGLTENVRSLALLDVSAGWRACCSSSPSRRTASWSSPSRSPTRRSPLGSAPRAR